MLPAQARIVPPDTRVDDMDRLSGEGGKRGRLADDRPAPGILGPIDQEHGDVGALPLTGGSRW